MEKIKERPKDWYNVRCTMCGKAFHLKPYRIYRTPRTQGYFCCRTCNSEYRKIFMKGEGNHQWGLKGIQNASFKELEIPRRNNNTIDIMVYVPNHPYADNNGRVKKHRLIVEQNHERYWDGFFDVIEGKFYLKKDVQIHHIDCDHNNNETWNLMPCTRSEHTKIHNKLDEIFNRLKYKRNLNNGKFESYNS